MFCLSIFPCNIPWCRFSASLHRTAKVCVKYNRRKPVDRWTLVTFQRRNEIEAKVGPETKIVSVFNNGPTIMISLFNPVRSNGIGHFVSNFTSALGHCTITSELAALRHSRLERSLYNLVYTPNDELNYFILYMESCSLSSYLKFILDVQAYENLIRRHRFQSEEEQQSLALTLFHRYLSIDATYLVPITDDIRRDTLCKKITDDRRRLTLRWGFLALICPSNESNIPDMDCFRLARDYIWQLIEQEWILRTARRPSTTSLVFFTGHIQRTYPVHTMWTINWNY